MNRVTDWKKIIVRACWILFGAGLLVLFTVAFMRKQEKKCREINIEITGVEKHLFIDEKDVLNLLNSNGALIAKPLHQINLRKLETLLETNEWVEYAELFFDNNQVLHVTIQEKEPLARVFRLNGESFYLDSFFVKLPLSTKLSARVPVFTGYPNQQKDDTVLLRQIIDIARYVSADSFFAAQIAQIHITPVHEFELFPLIGDHLIRLGDGNGLDNKFRRLSTFYRKAWLTSGIDLYDVLDIRFDHQVVAVRKGTMQQPVDSIAALKMIQGLSKNPLPSDTLPLNPPNTALPSAKPDKAIQLSTIPPSTTPVKKQHKPVVVPTVPVPVKKITQKAKVPLKTKKSPKTLMPRNNNKIQKPLS